MARFFVFAVCFLILAIGVAAKANEKSAAAKLLEKCLENYGPTSLRPVKDEATTTVVIVRLLITQIIALIETDQTLVLSGWLKWSWFDENFKWSSRKHGVEKLLVNTDQIWMPDIALHTNVDTGFERYKLKTAAVYPNGEVIYASPAILTFTCKINARLFPFDYQVCNMTFSSWNFHGNEVNLLASNGSDSSQKEFAQNGVWELKKIKVRRIEKMYIVGSKLEPFPELRYSLYLKRRPLFHVLSIIIPCLPLSILNLLVFLLPPEAGEKVGLGMTNLLALALFQQLVSAAVPPSSDNSPVITYYFTPMIGLACISVVNAVFMLKLFYYGRHNNPVPRWIQVVVLQFLSYAACYTKIAYEDEIFMGSKSSLIEADIKGKKEDGEEGEKMEMNSGESMNREEKMNLQETEKRHRDIDWQNVALIWDKFVFLMMVIVTTGAWR
ncbi:neuronal acetylcholine receptor subunit alpha-9-I-like [Amphiura filiformis]|uniref:neuronal acetylcholine receptor subunit alpha-9-I-like n=1 Tax=Amphiura filiformis TaxID=82378 RepID=UPI003B21D68F